MLQVLILVSLVLSLISLIQSKGTSVISWAVFVLALALSWPLLPLSL